MKENEIFADFEQGLELNLPADDLKAREVSDMREWHRSRLGRFSASRISKIMSSGRSKSELFGQTALSEIYKIAAERMLTPEGQEEYIDYLMSQDFKQTRWGIDHEDEARELVGAKRVSGRAHPDYPMFGASPDGIFEDGALCEIKCPYTIDKHLANILRTDETKNEYYAQMQAQMAVFGADVCRFVSYDPRSVKPLHVSEVLRDESMIEDMLYRIGEAEKIVTAVTGTKQ